MATLVLGAVGSAVGGALVPGSFSLFGATISGATLGGFLGGTLGASIDRRLFGRSVSSDPGPMKDLRVQGSREGTPIERVYGRARVGGQVIWASRYRVETRTQTQSQGGGKGFGGGGGGSATVTSYAYYVSLAVALAEGPIDRIGRVWAAGAPVNLGEYQHRVYLGTEDQGADPLIEATEGANNVPAYRGVAYIVFEDLALEPFGNRVPQFAVEIFRSLAAEGEGTLEQKIEAVNVIPGSGEFFCSTDIVIKDFGNGVSEPETLNNNMGQADFSVSMDMLEAQLPACEAASLVVSWFGDDLRAGQCALRPKVELNAKATLPLTWSVNGVDRASAMETSKDADGRSNFGGTPADAAVVQAITDLKARGLSVTFLPFILMDITGTEGNPDPYAPYQSQSPFPWRGRITQYPAAEVRGNLIAWSEDFSNTVWQNASAGELAVVSTDTDAPPGGGAVAADSISDSDGSVSRRLRLTGMPAEAGQTYAFSVYVKKAASGAPYPILRMGFLGSADLWLPATFDAVTGVWAAVDGGFDGTAASDEGGYWRVTQWATAPAGTTAATIEIYPAGNESGTLSLDAGATGSHVFFGAMLTLGEGPAPYLRTAGAALVTPDKTAAAADQVAAFFGSAVPADFAVAGTEVTWTGTPSEWSYRRFVLHYAHLCKAAGGVDTFLIGSEMRGLTFTRSAAGTYPAVGALQALAADVRAILGAGTQISYAADWSEYHSHRPADGSGDVYFHLDPLWADAEIDFIGIDFYVPLADWRDGQAHLDASGGAEGPYDISYLQSNVEGGEFYDWYYADDAAREAQIRSPIADGAYGEDWVFRNKDVRGWWLASHRNRPAGVRDVAGTSFVPQGKPIRFTEVGCPAVDKGANQPNVFYDPKSGESALPHFSNGRADDMAQRRFLEAFLSYWDPASGNNPVSSVYSAPMIDAPNTHIWAWDARPFPDFPARRTVWGDTENWRFGHWLNGRVGQVPLPTLVARICEDGGLTEYDASALTGLLVGYVVRRIASARDILAPLMVAHAFDALEAGGLIRFVPRGGKPVLSVPDSSFVAGGAREERVVLSRGQETDLPRSVKVTYIDADADYRDAVAESTRQTTTSGRVDETELPLVLEAASAQGIADMLLADRWVGRERAEFKLPPSMLALEPGDVISVSVNGEEADLRVEQVTDERHRALEAVECQAPVYRLRRGSERRAPASVVSVFGPPLVLFLDLPLLSGDEIPYAPHVAAFASPWPGAVAVYRSPSTSGFTFNMLASKPAVTGITLTDFYPGATSRWENGNALWVKLQSGTLVSADDVSLLGGRNVAAIGDGAGEWEVLQFANAELVGPDEYKLSRFLRGQIGTENAMAAPLPSGARFVLLDEALVQAGVSIDERALPFHWRYGPQGKDLGDLTYKTELRSFAGVGLRPLSPVHVRGMRVGSDIRVDWIRRTRIGGDSWEVPEIPLAEESEGYEIDILDSGAVVRTLMSSDPTVLYTAADQISDFGSAPVSPLTVRIYQMSTAFGRGAPREVTLYV